MKEKFKIIEPVTVLIFLLSLALVLGIFSNFSKNKEIKELEQKLTEKNGKIEQLEKQVEVMDTAGNLVGGYSNELEVVFKNTLGIIVDFEKLVVNNCQLMPQNRKNFDQKHGEIGERLEKILNRYDGLWKKYFGEERK